MKIWLKDKNKKKKITVGEKVKQVNKLKKVNSYRDLRLLSGRSKLDY